MAAPSSTSNPKLAAVAADVTRALALLKEGKAKLEESPPFELLEAVDTLERAWARLEPMIAPGPST